MSLKSNFELMANYNQWMNQNIYEAASSLSNAQLCENRGAFFSSIIGTLNHIFVGDTIWLKRFSEHPTMLKSLDEVRQTPYPQALDSILYADFSELKEARFQLDEIIINFSDELTETLLSSELEYKNTRGEGFIKNFGQLMQHFFNHQTHHRGQVSTLLNQYDVDIGVTDLLMMIPSRET